jgi:hypothetical protein
MHRLSIHNSNNVTTNQPSFVRRRAWRLDAAKGDAALSRIKTVNPAYERAADCAI